MSLIGRSLLRNKYRAFIPAQFPPRKLLDWNDSELLEHLCEAQYALGALRSTADNSPLFRIQPLVEAAASCTIDNSHTTALQIAVQSSGIGNKINRATDGIQSLDALQHALRKAESHEPFSLNLIKQLHLMRSRGQLGRFHLAGAFRTTADSRSEQDYQDSDYVPPPSHAVRTSLRDFKSFMCNKKYMPPIAIAGIAHAQFETIHPFVDGNGCVGRILIQYCLRRAELVTKSPLGISHILMTRKSEYFEALNSYRFAKDGPKIWMIFFLKIIKEAANYDIIAKRNALDVKQRHNIIINSFGRSAHQARLLLESFTDSLFINPNDVADITSIRSPANINKLITRFVNAGILEECTGKKRGRQYFYKEMYQLTH